MSYALSKYFHVNIKDCSAVTLSRVYLCPDGNLYLHRFANVPNQFQEPLVSVVKAMSKHQGADDVGDSIVDD